MSPRREMLVDEIAHDGRLRTSRRSGPLLQHPHVPGIELQRHRLHNVRVLPGWHDVNTDELHDAGTPVEPSTP